MMFHVIALAAGLSRRMGSDNKLLLPWGNTTILETTLGNIVRADIGKVWLVVGYEAEHIKNVVNNDDSSFHLPPLSMPADGVAIVTNTEYAKGMTTSIQAGIKAISPSEIDYTTGFMICLSDMPLITPDEYRRLFHHFSDKIKQDEKAIIRPVFNHQKGNPIIFSAFYTKEILRLTYTEGCKPIVQNHAKHVYEIEMPTDSILQDMDNLEDYKRLLSTKIIV